MATATTPKQGETRTIRPAQDVLARIRHDKEHFPDIGDIVIGYEDRHEGIMEVGVGQWCPVTEEEEWIPLRKCCCYVSVAPGRGCSVVMGDLYR